MDGGEGSQVRVCRQWRANEDSTLNRTPNAVWVLFSALRLDHPRGGGRSTQPLRSPTPRQVTRLDAGFSQNGTENRGDCFLAAGRTPRGRCILGGLWIVMAGLSVAKFSPLITRLGSSFARREELKTENQSRPRRQPDLRAAAIHQRVVLDS